MHHATLALLLSITGLAASVAVGAEREPQTFLGEYKSPKKVCFPGPKGDWSECEDAFDSLRLSRTENQQGRNIRIQAEFVFTNGHLCSFDGVGFWNRVDRVLAFDNESGCELVLVVAQQRLHTVVLKPDQCKEHCGMRGSLDGLVLQKVR
jgi:hypothetical protein